MMPIYAVGTLMMILFCGLALDAGMLELKKLQMQTAADAAALGAELEWERGNDDQVAQGKADAAANGFTDGVQNANVSVSWPPGTGDYASHYDVMDVKIAQQVKTIFLGRFNGGSQTLTAEAGALMPPCVYLTDAAGFGNAYTFKETNLQIDNDAGTDARCPMYVKRNLLIDGLSNLDAYAVNVTGAPTGSSLQGSYFPGPRFNAETLADPLSAIASPGFSSCTQTGYSVSGGSATLNPGTYCGTASKPGMTFSSATITLNPGLYVVTGGVHWSNSNIGGTGVTLYFTRGGGASYGQAIFDAHSKVYLSAPSDSSHGGVPTILIFGDRSWVATAAQDFICDSCLVKGDGIWYLTGTGLSTINAGSLWAPDYLGLVADSLVSESSTLGFFSDFSTVPTGNPFRKLGGLVQ